MQASSDEAMLRCLKSCDAVAVGLETNLRTCLLSCTVFHTGGVSPGHCQRVLTEYLAEDGPDRDAPDSYLKVCSPVHGCACLSARPACMRA